MDDQAGPGPDPPAEVAQELRAQLAAATAAACDAYRDNVRLVRLLTVISQAVPPAEMVDQALIALSQVFDASVTAIVHVVDDRLLVTGSCGLSEDDPAFVSGWPASPVAIEAYQSRLGLAKGVGELIPGVDVPPALEALGIRSAAWIPLGPDPGAGDGLVVIYRRRAEALESSELQLLKSVAYRLSLAVQAGERSVMAQRLARSGHRLARHLDESPLLDEAAHQLRDLVAADRALVITVVDGVAVPAACAGGGPTAPVPVSQLPGWSVLATGEPYREMFHREDGFGPPDPCSLLCVSVMRGAGPAILLAVTRSASRPFVDSEVEIVRIFSHHLRSAAMNAELYRALRESEASLRLITDSISDLIAVVDSSGRFRYVSPSHGRELELSGSELAGSEFAELVHPDDVDRVRAALGDVGGSRKAEYRLRTGRGGWMWVESALRSAHSSDGSVVVSSRIIEERKRFEDELRHQASHDPLTGLGNRVLARQRLEEALARDAPGEVGTLFCDLDKFKAINDRLGHDAGDELLQQVADRLRTCLRRDDLLARLGGDEFVFVLDEIHGHHELDEVGRRVSRAMAAPFRLGGERVWISASVGGVCGTRSVATASQMLRDADAAMYAAKGRGPGLLEIFDDDAATRSIERLSMRSDLAAALDQNALMIHYQPICELATGTTVGFEALLRWRHPVHGMIPPDVFIPLAEETGAIRQIGAWVLGQACHQLAEWHQLPLRKRLAMNVNVSARQLRHSALAAEASAAVKAAGIDPSDLWLEVTEHHSIDAEMVEVAGQIRERGFHLCLDDFGTSHSNLANLRRLPVECMKIDKSFVAGVSTRDRARQVDRGIVKAVLAIADSLDLVVIAEGIETQGQYDVLRELGCQRGQGFLLSRPTTAAQATVHLLDQTRPHAAGLAGLRRGRRRPAA